MKTLVGVYKICVSFAVLAAVLIAADPASATILEAFRQGSEPTSSVSASPFVFGGTDPIDPRVLSGLNAAYPANPNNAQPQAQTQTPPQDLGGLY